MFMPEPWKDLKVLCHVISRSDKQLLVMETLVEFLGSLGVHIFDLRRPKPVFVAFFLNDLIEMGLISYLLSNLLEERIAESELHCILILYQSLVVARFKQK